MTINLVVTMFVLVQAPSHCKTTDVYLIVKQKSSSYNTLNVTKPKLQQLKRLRCT